MTVEEAVRKFSALRHADHAAERLAAEEVEVEMRHLLMAVGAGVGEHPVAVGVEAEVLGDPAGGAEESGKSEKET
jgi:hypothetical protein